MLNEGDEATTPGERLLSASCPPPHRERERVVLGHGSGGRLSQQLLTEVFLKELDASEVSHREDQAIFAVPGSRLAMTTDSFVVSPLFFSGGNVGDLAVNGTVNDLAVGGAIPLKMSVAFVLEEGFALDSLREIVRSMARAARQSSVQICTGDTKVVEHGKGDGVYITTTGLGVVPDGRMLSASRARPGDCIVISGMMGDHGMAIMTCREGIELETTLRSDTAPLGSLVETLLAAAPDVRCMRDPTRGGVASALNEIAASSGVGMRLDESTLPLRPEVRAACELLGLDPLYVANEGKLIAILPPSNVESALQAMRAHALGRDACLIGTVVATRPGRVTVRPAFGGERLLPLLTGDPLPRIC